MNQLFENVIKCAYTYLVSLQIKIRNIWNLILDLSTFSVHGHETQVNICYAKLSPRSAIGMPQRVIGLIPKPRSIMQIVVASVSFYCKRRQASVHKIKSTAIC